MAIHFPHTNGNGWDVGSPSVTGYPVTVSAWINPDALSNWQFIWSAGDGTNDDMFALGSNGANLSCYARDTATQSTLGSTTMVVGTWYHVVTVYRSSTDRESYLNGVTEATNTVSCTPASFTAERIGDWQNANLPWDGVIAELGVWDVALTVAEIESLATGLAPTFIRPASLKSYVPLQSDERDVVYARTWTETGTLTEAPHPPLIHPTAQIIPFAPAVIPTGGAVHLDVDSDLQYTNTLTGNAISVSAWIYRIGSTPEPNEMVVASRQSGNGFLLYGSSNCIVYLLGTGGTYGPSAKGSGIANEEWHQIGFTYDGAAGEVKHYIDGVQAGTTGTTTVTTIPANAGLVINDRPGLDQHGDRWYTRVGGWTKVLSADDMAALGAGVDPKMIQPGGLTWNPSLDRGTDFYGDLVSGQQPTVNGTPQATGGLPALINPTAQIIPFAPAAVAVPGRAMHIGSASDDSSAVRVLLKNSIVESAAYTVAMWINPNTSDASDYYFCFETASPSVRAYDRISGGHEHRLGGGSGYTSCTNLTLDTWTNYVITTDGTATGAGINQYYDGVLQTPTASADGTGAVSMTRILIGGRTSGARSQNADYAYVAVWDVELSAEEAAALGAGVHPLLIRPSDLQACVVDTIVGNGEDAWIDVLGNETTIVGSVTASENDPPRIISPSAQIIPFVPAVVAGGANIEVIGHHYRKLLAGGRSF